MCTTCEEVREGDTRTRERVEKQERNERQHTHKRAGSRKQRAGSREQRAESESREQRAESREQREESREQRCLPVSARRGLRTHVHGA
jgi:hypothetical protein